MTDITPEQAREWRDDARPGPWYVHTTPDDPDGTFIYDEDGHMCIAVESAGSDYREADLKLAAAAPDMLATIAAQTWEWGVEDAYGDTAWMVCDHYEGTQDSETEAREYLSTFGPDSIARLVRRVVGPVEVVEE